MWKMLKGLLLLALLAALGWFLARWALATSWGRDIAEHRLGRAIEMDVTVAEVTLEWPFVVTLTGVEGRLPGARGADVTVPELRLDLWGRRRVEAHRPSIRLVQGAAGDWQPEALRSLVPPQDGPDMPPDMPLEESLDRIARSLGPGWSLTVAKATVVGRKAGETSDFPILGGLSWRFRDLALQGYGPLRHHRASYQTRKGQAAGGDGVRVVDWLSARRRPPLTLWPEEGMGPAVPAAEVSSPALPEGSPEVPAAGAQAAPEETPATDPASPATQPEAPAETPPLQATEPKV